MSAVMSMSSTTTTSSYLPDLTTSMYVDEKNFLLGSEQPYPDAGELDKLPSCAQSR